MLLVAFSRRMCCSRVCSASRYGLTPEQFPVADRAYQRMFSIPLFTAMSDDEQGRVIAALRAVVR